MSDDVFEVVPAFDPRTQVRFRVPRKGQDALEFAIPRMQYMDEPTTRQMRDDLREIDRYVPQFDINEEPIYMLESDGFTEKVDPETGDKVPLLGPPQRTVLERTKIVALTMLRPVIDADLYEQLEKLTVGELDQILGHWTKVSEKPLDGLPLGESSASSTS